MLKPLLRTEPLRIPPFANLLALFVYLLLRRDVRGRRFSLLPVRIINPPHQIPRFASALWASPVKLEVDPAAVFALLVPRLRYVVDEIRLLPCGGRLTRSPFFTSSSSFCHSPPFQPAPCEQVHLQDSARGHPTGEPDTDHIFRSCLVSSEQQAPLATSQSSLGGPL